MISKEGMVKTWPEFHWNPWTSSLYLDLQLSRSLLVGELWWFSSSLGVRVCVSYQKIINHPQLFSRWLVKFNMQLKMFEKLNRFDEVSRRIGHVRI
jgi:hypothetical protein